MTKKVNTMTRMLIVFFTMLVPVQAQCQQTISPLYPKLPGMAVIEDAGTPCESVCAKPHILPPKLAALCATSCKPGYLVICGGPGARCRVESKQMEN